MQVTIDIPEPLYRALENSAQREKVSVSEVLLRSFAYLFESKELPKSEKRVELPLISGAEPGPLMRMGANMNHVAFMSDEEIDELLAGR